MTYIQNPKPYSLCPVVGHLIVVALQRPSSGDDAEFERARSAFYLESQRSLQQHTMTGLYGAGDINGCRKSFVAKLREQFADLDLTYSIGGQISFDVFPKVRPPVMMLLQ